MVRPQIEKLPGKLAAVIDKYPHWRTTTCNELVADPDHVLTAQSMTYLRGQRFAGEDIDNGENPNPRPIDHA
jgi:hypothetical protein